MSVSAKVFDKLIEEKHKWEDAIQHTISWDEFLTLILRAWTN